MLAIGAVCFETPLQMAITVAEAFPLLFVFNPTASRINIFNSRGAKCYTCAATDLNLQSAAWTTSTQACTCALGARLFRHLANKCFKVQQQLLQTH